MRGKVLTFLVAFGLLMTSAALAGPSACLTVSGNWLWANSSQGGTGVATFETGQNFNTGALSGELFNWYCNSGPNAGLYLDVAVIGGTASTTGSFDFNMASGTSTCVPSLITITEPSGSAGCQVGTMSAGNFGSQNLTATACTMPSNYNKNTFKQFDSAGLGHWQEDLSENVVNGYGLGTDTHFGGRTITSVVSSRSDGCIRYAGMFQGGKITPPFPLYSNGPIYVDSTNIIDERQGWTDNAVAVEAIRTAYDSPLPCTTTYVETMNIDCASGPTPYEQFSDTYTVNGAEGGLSNLNADTVTLVHYIGTDNPIKAVYPHGLTSVPQNQVYGRSWVEQKTPFIVMFAIPLGFWFPIL